MRLMAHTSDEITLTLPRSRPFHGVAHLVLGGLAARHNLTVDGLEDLRLALDGLLDRPGGEHDVTLALRIDDAAIHASVGPFDGPRLEAELEQQAEGAVGLRRLLETVVDRFELAERAGAHWVELTKSVERAAT